MKTLEDKTMTGKTAVNLPAGNPPTILLVLNHTYGKLGRKTGRKTAFWGRQVST